MKKEEWRKILERAKEKTMADYDAPIKIVNGIPMDEDKDIWGYYWGEFKFRAKEEANENGK